MAVTDEQWAAFLTTARLLQPSDASIVAPSNVVGRSIRFMVDRLTVFWARHQATLTPYLTQLAIAALNALLAAKVDIDNVDPPGPP